MDSQKLKPGDVLFYKDGQNLLSRTIRWGTNSKYSHVLMYIGSGKCIESDFSIKKYLFEKNYKDGVKIVDLDKILSRKGSHDVYRSKFKIKYLKKIAEKLNKKEYGYDFIGLIWRGIIAAKIKLFNKASPIIAHHKTKYYCSELVRTIFLEMGASFEDDILPEETTPASESRRTDLSFIGNLKSTHEQKKINARSNSRAY